MHMVTPLSGPRLEVEGGTASAVIELANSADEPPKPKMVDPPPWPGYVAHTRWPGDGPIYMFEAQAYGPADPDTTYPWGEAGCTSTVLAGSLIDCAPGSALETAIGAGNLGTLGQQALQDAANGGAGGISN